MLDDTLPTVGEEPPALFAGRYRLERVLGRGVSKQVFLAFDERLDRQVALALFIDPGQRARARIEREMALTGRLGEHPNVVTIHDAGEADGQLYLVLRAMLGGSLEEALRAAPGRRLPAARATQLAAEIAAALAHAHGLGVVHRDVKPGNVWLTSHGQAALGDFGIALAADRARLTRSSGPVGTALYLAPEQIRGEGVGPPSDLYALGATLFELLTGRPPFEADDLSALFALHLHAPPPPLAGAGVADPALERLVAALLAKDPADRPASAADVAEALGGGAATAPAAARAGPLTAGVLVGRDDVLERLRGAFEDGAAGRRRLVLIAGEPGIGKSRLIDELTAWAAARGARVVRGLCSEDEGAAPYRPWTQIVRALQPEASPGDDLRRLLGADDGDPQEDGEDARLRMFDAIARLLGERSRAAPLVAVVEDLHWADRSSLDLLSHVVREQTAARLVLLVSSRDASGETVPALREALGQIAGRPGCEIVELEPLGAPEIARWLELAGRSEGGAELAEALQRRTGGNPLFVAEIVRMLDRHGAALPQGIPSGVRAVVGRRVERLPAETAELLRLAAAAGAEFAPALLAVAAGIEPLRAHELLEAAEAERLVASDRPGRLRFSHALVREVVYADQPVSARGRRHARLAAALEAGPAENDPSLAGELARHYIEAARVGADAEPAMRWSVTAARAAERSFAFAEAAGNLERALEAAELAGAGARRRCDLLLELAEAHSAAGDLDDSRRAYEQAAELARAFEDPEPFAQAALGVSAWQAYGAVDHPAIALLEEAARRLGDHDGALRARVLGRLAARLPPGTSEEPRRAMLLDAALAMARRLGEEAVLARLLATSPRVHWQPDQVAWRERAAAEAIELARAGGDYEPALWAHVTRITDSLATGAIRAAEAELDAYDADSAHLRRDYYRWYGTVLRAGLAILRGQLEEGERLSRAAVELNREHEADAEQEHLVQTAAIALARGDAGAVDLEALGAFADRYADLPAWRALLARMRWEAGDAATARAELERCLPLLETAVVDGDWICAAALAIEVAAGLGEPSSVAGLAERLRPYAERNAVFDKGWAAFGAIARPLGLLALAVGDRERGEADLRRALELHRAWGAAPLARAQRPNRTNGAQYRG